MKIVATNYFLEKQLQMHHLTNVGLYTAIFLYVKTVQARLFGDTQKGFPLQSRLWQIKPVLLSTLHSANQHSCTSFCYLKPTVANT